MSLKMFKNWIEPHFLNRPELVSLVDTHNNGLMLCVLRETPFVKDVASGDYSFNLEVETVKSYVRPSSR